MLHDTKQNISNLSEQIRVLTILQKKSKTDQNEIQRELDSAFKMLKKLKFGIFTEEMGDINGKEKGADGE